VSDLVAETPRPLGIIRNYARDVWTVLTRPAEFFGALPLRGGASGPLAFALVTHWLGEAASFLWRALASGYFASIAGDLFERAARMAGDVASDVDSPGRHATSQQFIEMGERFKQWFFGAGPVIVDPFFTLARICFMSFFVFIGARLLVPAARQAEREVTYESALRVVCYGMAPAILAALPVFGTPVSYLYGVAVTIIGASEAYRISRARALVVSLFPQILLLSVIGLALTAGLLLVFKLVASMFSL
jgi:hypothetical protein